MDFYEAIEKRRTVRKFKSPATMEQLNRILVAGSKAPSGGNQQGWEFILVDDPALIEKISERKYILNRGNKPREEQVSPEQDERAQGQKDSFANASSAAVYYKKGARAEVWMCIENILLAVVARGLATRIGAFGGGAEKDIDKLLQIPEGMELAAVLSIGVPAMEVGPRNLRPEGSWLHRNRF